MVFDSIENAEIYYGLGENFKTAFEFLKKTDFNSIKEERIEIDGETQVEPVGLLDLKGIGTQVETFKVVGLRAAV